MVCDRPPPHFEVGGLELVLRFDQVKALNSRNPCQRCGRRVTACPTSSTRRLHRGTHQGAAVTSRRGRGEDSVYLDGDRSARPALGCGTDGRRIRKKVSGAKKAEVLRKLLDLRSELNAGLPVPDDRLTRRRFLGSVANGKSSRAGQQKTLDSYTDTVRLHIKPSLGRKVLRKLTVSDVDQLLAWKRNAGYSANHGPHHSSCTSPRSEASRARRPGFAERSRSLHRPARQE